MIEQMLWVEKYRPKTIEECILPDGIKETFQEFVNKKEIPNLLLSGTAGVGKTTVAKALCEEAGYDYIFINGSNDRGIDTLRGTIISYASSVSLTGNRKVIIIDEADNLTPDAQKALRGVIEDFASNCSFIFTCNFKNRIMDAIHSRCTCIDFKLNGSKVKVASAFMKRIQFILDSEGIQYDKNVVAAIITKHFPDNRRVINELQRYAITGSIDKGMMASVADVQITDLISAMKMKDFALARKWVSNNLDNDPSKIYRKLYDTLYEELKPNSVPQLVLHLAKYQYQGAFVADHEINMIACLTEIMVDCEFK
jgi:DNA polymerase III delta prime subunit